MASPRREAALAAAAYVLLALGLWWPLPARAAVSTLAHPFGDPLLNAWTLAWDADSALRGFTHYWDGLFFFPYPDTVAYSEHLLGIALFTAPIQWITGNPILVLNLALVASTALVGWGTFLLARTVTGRADAAFVAGVAMAASPYRLAQVWHLQVLVSGWMPIALAGLHRYLAAPSRTAWTVFVAAFALQALSNGYFLFYTALAVAVVALHGLWAARADLGPRMRGLLTAAAVVLVAIAPVAVAYARVRREQGFTRTSADLVQYAASLESYGQVSSSARLWAHVLPVGPDDRQLFPGLIVLLLAGAAVVGAAWRSFRPDATSVDGRTHRSAVWLYAAIALMMGVLSLGPQPMAWGTPLPIGRAYTALMAVLPGFEGLRAPARMATVVHLALAVLAAFGLAGLTTRLGAWRRGAVAGAVTLALVAEGYGGPPATAAFPTPDMRADQPVYEWLARQEGGALLELPVGDVALATRHLYRTLDHGHRIVNGYSGYGSVMQDFVGGPPFTEVARTEHALEMARAIGIRWIVVHPPLYEHPAAGAAVAEAIARTSTQVARVVRFPTAMIAELRPAASPRAAVRDASWREVATAALTVTASHNPDAVGAMLDGVPGTRWATGARQGSGETVTVTFREPTDVSHLRLDLAARSLGDYPRGLRISSAAGDDETWVPLFDDDILPALGLSLVREPRTPGIDVSLPPNRTRRLRLQTTGQTRHWFWSIHQLRVWSR